MSTQRWTVVSVLALVGCAAQARGGAEGTTPIVAPSATTSASASAPRSAAPAPDRPAPAPPRESAALHRPGSVEGVLSDTGLLSVEATSDLGGGVGTTTIVRWQRDASGRPTALERVHNGGTLVTTSLTWDPAGRLVGERTETGMMTGTSTSYAYDAAGRVAQICSFQQVGPLAVMPNNSCVRYAYDEKGRVTRERSTHFSSPEEPNGAPETVIEVRYVEDAEGRVVDEDRYQDGRRASTRHYARDARGRVIVETFDALHTPEVEETKTFAYGASGEVVGAHRVRGGTFGEGEADFRYESGRLVSAEGYVPEHAYAHTQRSVVRFRYR